MGAKYLPTKKDLKFNQRFDKKDLLPKSAFKKPGVAKAAPAVNSAKDVGKDKAK